MYSIDPSKSQHAGHIVYEARTAPEALLAYLDEAFGGIWSSEHGSFLHLDNRFSKYRYYLHVAEGWEVTAKVLAIGPRTTRVRFDWDSDEARRQLDDVLHSIADTWGTALLPLQTDATEQSASESCEPEKGGKVKPFDFSRIFARVEPEQSDDIAREILALKAKSRNPAVIGRHLHGRYIYTGGRKDADEVVGDSDPPSYQTVQYWIKRCKEMKDAQML